MHLYALAHFVAFATTFGCVGRHKIGYALYVGKRPTTRKDRAMMTQYQKIEKFQARMAELNTFIERWAEDENAEFDKGDIDRIMEVVQFVPGMFQTFLALSNKMLVALGDLRDDIADDLGECL